MKKARKLLVGWRTFFRGILYPAGFLTFIGLVVSLYEPLVSQSIQVNVFVLLLATMVLLVVATELIFLATSERLRGHKNQDEAIRKFGPLAAKIETSKSIHLLGTTFKSFTDDEANLRALQRSLASGADVKVLIINPDGEEISRMLIARKDRNSFTTEDLLRNEIRSSISRFLNALGEGTCKKILRFYRSTRSVSIYRIDEEYFVTCYTHGRGGSSPVITYQAKGEEHDEFADCFKRGFSELWEAESTLDLTKVAHHTLELSRKYQNG